MSRVVKQQYMDTVQTKSFPLQESTFDLLFMIRDWAGFMEAIEDTYGEAVRVLLELKSSISR